MRAKDVVNRLAFALRERVQPGTAAYLLEEDAVFRKAIDGTASGAGAQGVPAFDDVEVPRALPRPDRVVVVQQGVQVLAAAGVQVRIVDKVPEPIDPWPVAFDVLGMEVVRGPMRVPAGTKPGVVVIRPTALKIVPDGLETPARFDEPSAQPPAGLAHRFCEIRGFGAGEIRGKSACVGGKRVALLDRFL